MRRVVMFAILLLAGVSASAQVALELKLNRTVYMQYEPIVAQVKLRNYSGQPLVFGEEARLRGEILFEAVRGGATTPAKALKSGGYPMTGTIVMPGATTEVLLPVSKMYDFNQLGTYRIHAYLKHNMFKDVFRSPGEVKIEVSPGVSIWKQTVGIPDVLRIADKMPPEQLRDRTYEIRILVENSTKYYYLVVEDKETVYAVLRIGKELGMEKFKVEVDAMSRLHVIVPISPKIFRSMTINVNGQLEQEQYLKTTKTIPSLVRESASGRVYVVGGAEARPGIDYEAKNASEGGANAPVGPVD